MQGVRLYTANNKVLRHVLFWVAWVVLNTCMWGSFDDNYKRQFITEFYELPEKMIVVYLNLYLLMPRWLLRKKYYRYGASLFLMLSVMALIMRAIYIKFLAVQYYHDNNLSLFNSYRILKYIFFNLNIVLFITSGIRLFAYWDQQQQRNHELVQETLKGELYYLKGQLHPHFLFNTLNNIYSLCLKKSDIAPTLVLKLSSLMSYMLYDSQKDSISLLKDIDYMKSYIELEKIRYGERLTFSFNQSGDLEGRQIAPLLMLPFVENAFKHGLSDDVNNVWVTIDLKVKQDVFYMKIRNSISKPPSFEPQLPNGIGLQNIKRRLALLYPDRHSLEITADIEYFEADLKINL